MDPKAESPPRKQHHNGPQRENPPQPDQPQRRQPDDELRDLSRLTAILARMQEGARGRAVRYLIDRFGPQAPFATQPLNDPDFQARRQAMKTVQQHWEEFWKAVKPPQCDAIQEQEMRRSYYGGFASAIFAMSDISANCQSEDAGVNAIEMLRQECIQFGRDILAGKR